MVTLESNDEEENDGLKEPVVCISKKDKKGMKIQKCLTMLSDSNTLFFSSS